MTGETTVRHAHRIVSSSGASVSEPEVARPLITPDEAMRLDSNEALIFTSGRPAIRATKLRYYSDPSFKRLAEIAPPAKSDRIEYAPHFVDDDEEPKSGPEKDEPKELQMEQQSVQVVGGRPRRAKPAPAEQFSFLKFAVASGKDAADAPKEEGVKERLL
jgi:type IV secretory pathway TraG/TraD family ATPase VirD4